MNSSPLISVILPAGHDSPYIFQAIDSCLSQSYKNLELILVDDGLTVEARSRISEYLKKDGRIKFLRHESDRKLPGALNTGFEIAKGDYLTWTSDDNYYLSSALEEMAGVLNTRPEIAIVYAGCKVINEQGREILSVPVLPPEKLSLLNCVGACFLYRREVHEKNGGYAPRWFGAEDYDFWLRASLMFRFLPLEKYLYVYRTHQNSLSHRLRGRPLSLLKQKVLEETLPKMKWVPPETRAEALLCLAGMGRKNRCPSRPAHRELLRFLIRHPGMLLRRKPWPTLSFLLGRRPAALLRLFSKHSGLIRHAKCRH
ncbi:MAG TPA: glycosyltransferase [Candidatus Omnitrophota bacterium]|nr:glycosyltransferase [Candidatus Omnitrophota bacterium]